MVARFSARGPILHPVNLSKRVLIEGKWRYCPVVLTANGRIRQDWVVVGDREELHAEGEYHLDWRQRGKRKRLAVGKDATHALNLVRGKQSGRQRGAGPARRTGDFPARGDRELPCLQICSDQEAQNTRSLRAQPSRFRRVLP